jgi:hypothetical protein
VPDVERMYSTVEGSAKAAVKSVRGARRGGVNGEAYVLFSEASPRGLCSRRINHWIAATIVFGSPSGLGTDSELLCLRKRVSGDPSGEPVQDSYLVDSASSHMLVSKIKPCMSKYKQSIR